MTSLGVEVSWDPREQLVSPTWRSCKIGVFELGLDRGVGVHQVKNGDRGSDRGDNMCQVIEVRKHLVFSGMTNDLLWPELKG